MSPNSRGAPWHGGWFITIPYRYNQALDTVQGKTLKEVFNFYFTQLILLVLVDVRTIFSRAVTTANKAPICRSIPLGPGRA
jgi:hypothetical protein